MITCHYSLPTLHTTWCSIDHWHQSGAHIISRLGVVAVVAVASFAAVAVIAECELSGGSEMSSYVNNAFAYHQHHTA